MKKRRPMNNEFYEDEEFYFQQDWALPHYATKVRRLLNKWFTGKWNGHKGAIDWTELTPIDFFLWVLKDIVYARNPTTIIKVVEFITNSCHEKDNNKELCRDLCMSVKSCLQIYVINVERILTTYNEYKRPNYCFV